MSECVLAWVDDRVLSRLHSVLINVKPVIEHLFRFKGDFEKGVLRNPPGASSCLPLDGYTYGFLSDPGRKSLS